MSESQDKKYSEINLSTFGAEEIIKYKNLGWTELKWTYDDMYGGIYLGGINPLSKKWDDVEGNAKFS